VRASLQHRLRLRHGPGCPFACQSGHYHLGRFRRPYRAGRITLDDVATIVRNYPATVPGPGPVRP